ncbi:MAG TPA: phosphoglycerate kinase [Bacilli bacterium]|nr:phosphoglycerate kinase [Bacilli bacterium]
MKKTIRDYDLNNKKVIIRVDFNVPIKNGVITDDNRIKESLKTINYAIDNNAKVILLSHLGRVKTVEDKEKNTLLPVSKRLSELLNKDVSFINETRGEKLETAINNMNSKDVILVENTRYEDLDGEKESKNNEELGKYWASLGDLYINDAFGTAHRAHASNVGIASNLPNGIGFLIEKELDNLEAVVNNPKRPFTVILGGSKVNDKIGVIENLVNKADYILVGGGMSFTFLKASGLPIGSSLLDSENIEFCKRILKDYEDKVILPIDVVCSTSMEENSPCRECFISDIKDEEIGLDIGHATIKVFKDILKDSKTVIWNGPVGMFEQNNYANGTKEICEILKEIDATTILGGGDTASAAINFGYKDSFTHISTGGGASLELLEGKVLPGIDIINDK